EGRGVKIRFCIVLTLLLIGCATSVPTEPPPGPTAAELKSLPGVHAVHVKNASAPKTRIIHILDWHFVPKDDFAADLRSESDDPISDDEMDDLYDEFLDEVEAVQEEQMAVAAADARSPGCPVGCQVQELTLRVRV
ncbi:MAG: hypothetical protein N2C14_26395, partial [Planctomycetales bacterium]